MPTLERRRKEREAEGEPGEGGEGDFHGRELRELVKSKGQTINNPGTDD